MQEGLITCPMMLCSSCRIARKSASDFSCVCLDWEKSQRLSFQSPAAQEEEQPHNFTETYYFLGHNI